uniref:F-box domain-containing protein n=2 Tax=Brassica oleracea TaxID=3712 RepID=A0A0D3AH10_BRAOL
MQDSEAGEIPEDLMIEIAARLPAKSVMRFKCISKFWSSLPLSTHFCNRFL